MNDLIKELEKRCWDHQTNHLDTEKFAELIVRECIRYCSDNLSKTVGGALKIHFGIQDLTTEELSKDADEWYEKLLWEEKE